MKYMKELIKLGLLVSAAISISLNVYAQGTAFTYQGVLNDTGAAANGLYDLQLTIYDSNTNGNIVAGPVTNTAVVVSNGLFTTTVDFGDGVFLGQPLWLDIAVSTNGAGDFAELTPLQMLTPTPYSIFSATAGYSTAAGTASSADAVISGAVSVPQLSTPTAPSSGQVLAFDGTQLVWQDPVIGGGSGGWSLSGNLGTTAGLNFLGTIDTQPLELKVAGVRAFRLEPDSSGNSSPNVIGGSSANYVSNTVVGATIAGGGTASVPNRVVASWGAIGGGENNVAGGTLSYVGGGYQNLASGYIATVAGGAYNSAISNESAVLGGAFNVASGIGSVVAGGGWDGSNPGGNAARGTGSAIGGGLNNAANGAEAAVSGGYGNSASGPTAFVGGGNGNTASGSDLVPYFSGGFFHFFAGDSTVSGGGNNTASASGATVPGGAFNVASGDLSFAAGYRAVAAGGGTFVWSDESSDSPFTCSGANQFVIRATGGVGIGTATPAAALDVNGSIHASGSASVCSITIRGGCDLAEPFTTTEPELASGSVVIIDPENPGQLKLSNTAYDTRVAGIISGANGVNPGIALHQEGTFDGGQNVALTGRVYALADASNGAIVPGDLLTTSSTPGHAMKVKDHAKAQGAILGKAMSGLLQGKGMVLVLVTLE